MWITLFYQKHLVFNPFEILKSFILFHLMEAFLHTCVGITKEITKEGKEFNLS